MSPLCGQTGVPATPAGGDTVSPAGVAVLPCLNRNNSNETPAEAAPALENVLAFFSTAARKSAAALGWNVVELDRRFGIERLGFLTLTFPDGVTCRKEAQRRFNSLKTRILSSRYVAHIRIVERHKARTGQAVGAIHYHLLVVLSSDIRTGVDFAAFETRDYRSAPQALRDEWAYLREILGKYGFGRHELMPIKSTAEGIGKYVGKYIGKSLLNRNPADKGWRLVEYSGVARMASARFAFVSDGSASWRRKVALFAQIVSQIHGVRITSPAELSQVLGPKWAFNSRSFILELPDVDSDGVFVP